MDDEIKRLEELVKQGDADAMARLGYMYDNGKGVLRDHKKAKELYEQAANLGNSGAMNNLGTMYFFGQGVSRDYSKAKEWFEQSAILGNDVAMVNLGAMYEYEQDHEQAKKWYEDAYKAGNEDAKEHIDRINKKIKGKQKSNNDEIKYEDKSIEELEELVKQNDDKAMNELGLRFCYRNGVEEDCQKAIYLFRKAILLNNSSAMNNLGYMYETGHGVSKDYIKAREFYEQATNLKNAEAMRNLAHLYFYGLGIQADIEKGKKLYEQACDLGNIDAMYELGSIYRIGVTIPQDYVKALEFFEKGKKTCENLYRQTKDNDYLIRSREFESEIMFINEKIKLNSIESAQINDELTSDSDKYKSQSKVNEDVERLKSLVSNLSSKYISREQTVRMLANNIYHGRRVIKEIKDNKMVRDNISTILLISSTGGGKTAIVSDLAKEFDVPFTSVSLSAGYTQAGYKGLDLQDIFKKLINAADGDVAKAEEGIIILDEFDKIRTKEDSHDEEFKRALQQELLSYLEGREVQLDTKGGPITFNTSKLTFILAGAFQDITEYDMNYTNEDIKEAISKGYESELLGRIGIYHYMRKYTKEDYINILNDSKISPLTNFIVSCSIHGKNVITSPYSLFIESVAEEAVKLDKGVRGLNSIFANILNWYLDDLIYGESDILLMESYEDIKKKKGRGK